MLNIEREVTEDATNFCRLGLEQVSPDGGVVSELNNTFLEPKHWDISIVLICPHMLLNVRNCLLLFRQCGQSLLAQLRDDGGVTVSNLGDVELDGCSQHLRDFRQRQAIILLQPL